MQEPVVVRVGCFLALPKIKQTVRVPFPFKAFFYKFATGIEMINFELLTEAATKSRRRITSPRICMVLIDVIAACKQGERFAIA